MTSYLILTRFQPGGNDHQWTFVTVSRVSPSRNPGVTNNEETIETVTQIMTGRCHPVETG